MRPTSASTRVSQQMKKAPVPPPITEFEETVPEGKDQVSYVGLAIGQYTIEVSGNSHYMSSQKQVLLLNEENKETITVFVGVKPRIDTDAEFFFYQEEHTMGGVYERAVKPEKVEAKAILISTPRQQEDFEEFEVDINYNATKGLWTCTLQNGTYLLSVKSKDFREVNQVMQVQAGHMFDKFKMEAILPNERIYNFVAVDAFTGRPIP